MTAVAKRSPLGAQLQGRPRRIHVYDVASYMCMGENRARVAVRLPKMREQNRALDAALGHVSKRAEHTPAVGRDPVVLDDAKAAFIVAQCCLEADRPDDDEMPLWPTGEEVIADLTADEIGVFVRLINEVRAKMGPTPEAITDDKVEAFITMAAVGASTDVPDEVLAPLPPHYIAQLFILTAVKLAEARQRIAYLTREPESETAP